MVLDTEKCILAIEDEIIYLTTSENIVLNALISNKFRGISTRELKQYIYPYSFDVRQIILKLRRKLKDYLSIYSHNRRYYIEFNLSYINKRSKYGRF